MHDVCMCLFNYFPCIGLCQAETTGDNVTQGLFFWKTTDPSGSGRTYLVCPYGPTAEEYSDDDDEEFNEGSTPFFDQLSLLASRHCICTDVTCKNPKWDKPITSVCSYKTFNDSDTTQDLSGLLQVSGKYFTREFKLDVGYIKPRTVWLPQKGPGNFH